MRRGVKPRKRRMVAPAGVSSFRWINHLDWLPSLFARLVPKGLFDALATLILGSTMPRQERHRLRRAVEPADQLSRTASSSSRWRGFPIAEIVGRHDAGHVSSLRSRHHI